MDHRILFTERDKVELVGHDAPEPRPGQVRVATTVSLMSTGTETTVLTGHFDEGSHHSWYATLPFRAGYLTVGVVDAVGADELPVGSRVFHRAGHGSRFTLPADTVTPVPDGLGDDEAVWAGLAKVAYRAAHAAPFRLGGAVVIIGAGPVGQMATRWAAAAGCVTVVVVGRTPRRLELAVKGGATHVVESPAAGAGDGVRAALGGNAPVVVDATGDPVVFAEALRLADWHGTVVLLGDTGHPTEQHLTPDVMVKGLTVTAVHDQHNWHGGDEAVVLRRCLDLMARGRFDCAGLITHRFAPADAAKAYELATTRRPETVGIAFDWT